MNKTTVYILAAILLVALAADGVYLYSSMQDEETPTVTIEAKNKKPVDTMTNNTEDTSETKDTSDTQTAYKDITVAEAKKIIDEEENVVVIDVSPYYDDGHIPGAVSYPVGTGELDDAIPTLDKNKTYVVYCHSDSPAILASEKLIEAGMDKVYRITGNYQAWVDAGYPIEK